MQFVCALRHLASRMWDSTIRRMDQPLIKNKRRNCSKLSTHPTRATLGRALGLVNWGSVRFIPFTVLHCTCCIRYVRPKASVLVVIMIGNEHWKRGYQLYERLTELGLCHVCQKPHLPPDTCCRKGNEDAGTGAQSCAPAQPPPILLLSATPRKSRKPRSLDTTCATPHLSPCLYPTHTLKSPHPLHPHFLHLFSFLVEAELTTKPSSQKNKKDFSFLRPIFLP